MMELNQIQNLRNPSRKRRGIFLVKKILSLFVSSTSVLGYFLLNTHQAFSTEHEKTIREIISAHYGADSRVEIGSVNSDYAQLSNLKNIRLIHLGGGGRAVFSATSDNKSITFTVNYTAWKKARVSKKRILPGSTLSDVDLEIRDVEVSSGFGNQSWALFVEPEDDLKKYEAKNTILEGTPILRTQIQKKPDTRRGDPVRVNIVSGGLILTADAIVQESANIGDTVRILTTKTKRELRGILKEKDRVEVVL